MIREAISLALGNSKGTGSLDTYAEARGRKEDLGLFRDYGFVPDLPT
jgi:hypothetical protein